MSRCDHWSLALVTLLFTVEFRSKQCHTARASFLLSLNASFPVKINSSSSRVSDITGFKDFVSFASLALVTCTTGSFKVTDLDVEIVVSAHLEEINWLGAIDVPIVVYVHNRSTMWKGYHSGGFVPTPSDRMTRAVDSQKRLEALNPSRMHPIEFLSIANLGDEAIVYISEILRRYDSLPKVMIFLMGHRRHWHAEFEMDQRLKSMCFDPAVAFRNLNDPHCICFNDGSEDGRFAREVLMSNYATLWEPEFGPFPDNVCFDCCAQFAVARDAIQAHPREFYQKLLGAVGVNRTTTLEREWRFIFESRASSQYCEGTINITVHGGPGQPRHNTSASSTSSTSLTTVGAIWIVFLVMMLILSFLCMARMKAVRLTGASFANTRAIEMMRRSVT